MKLFTVFFAVLALQVSAHADLNDGACADTQKAQVVSNQQINLHGQNLSYQVTTGFMEVTALDKTSKACIFYTSYVVPPANGLTGKKGPKRPLTFAFNGGPGSASLWLHLGFMGPYRVDMGSDGLVPPASQELIPNESSPLDVSDLVLIDPVATGFSHAESGSTTDKFTGVTNDYSSIAVFVQNYLNFNNRWDSSKYILGESYGGMRGNLLVKRLQDMHIAIDGLILVSPALSQMSFFGLPNNLIPYWTYLPNFAATAWYHKKIAPQYQSLDADGVYEQAKKFAQGEYRTVLELGSLATNAQFDDVAAKLSDFIGLPVSTVARANLKITDREFFVELLGPEQMLIGRFDSRAVGAGNNGVQSHDPSIDVVGPRYVSGINQYLRVNLNFNLRSPYAEFGDTGGWPDPDSELGDTMVALSQAMAMNPNLRVLIASGYFDLACPMGTVEYEVSQMPFGRKLVGRIQQRRYFGGHMMYLNPPALLQLKQDFASFVH